MKFSVSFETTLPEKNSLGKKQAKIYAKRTKTE